MKKAGEEADWEIDSAAIGAWHVGRDPDQRALATMRKHNLTYNNRARQIKTPDFKKYDYIFGMDDENIDDLKRMIPPDSTTKILLLGDFDPQGDRIIRDPYYVSSLMNPTFELQFSHLFLLYIQQDRGSDGFEKAYEQCVRCCKNFLTQVHENKV